MTVISGCPAGTSDITDDLSLGHLLSAVNCQLAAMRVSGFGSVRMVNQDVISVTVGPAGICDSTCFGSPDGCSSICGNVCSGVSVITPDWAGDITAVYRPDVSADITFGGIGACAGEIMGGACQRTDYNFCVDRFYQCCFGDNSSFGFITVNIGNLAGYFF